MRIATSLVVFLGLATASDALAERRCEVAFVRAPADVRLVIESWLAAEPRCTGTIELRVVATDSGGYYLVAQRPDGRIHEREVPDAQSAGVLVASWVADDWTSDEPVAAAPIDPQPRVSVIEAPSTVSVVVTAPAPRAPSRSSKWVTLGIELGPTPDDDGGFHLDIDLVQRGNWTFGVSGEYVEAQHHDLDGEGTVEMYASDWRLFAKAARVFRMSDRATLTALFGVGIVHTELNVITPMTYTDPYYGYSGGSMESPIADAGLLIARELGTSWALSVGPKLTFSNQKYYAGDYYAQRPVVEFGMLFAARYRL